MHLNAFICIYMILLSILKSHQLYHLVENDIAPVHANQDQSWPSWVTGKWVKIEHQNPLIRWAQPPDPPWYPHIWPISHSLQKHPILHILQHSPWFFEWANHHPMGPLGLVHIFLAPETQKILNDHPIIPTMFCGDSVETTDEPILWGMRNRPLAQFFFELGEFMGWINPAIQLVSSSCHVWMRIDIINHHQECLDMPITHQ